MATHLKSLAKRARLNEGHVKAARAYKARVASLTSERAELRAARDELRKKAVLLDEARRETSEAVSSIERLTDECHGLRGDLQRQETLVVQRDGAIASLRGEACTQ